MSNYQNFQIFGLLAHNRQNIEFIDQICWLKFKLTFKLIIDAFFIELDYKVQRNQA